MKINIHYIIMAQHTFHDLQIIRINKSTIIHNQETRIVNGVMKGVPHISICQGLWSEKLSRNIYLKIECLPWTIIDFNMKWKLTIFFNVKQKTWVDERGDSLFSLISNKKVALMKGGVVVVDSIVLFVAHKHIINKQIKQTNNQKRKKQQETLLNPHLNSRRSTFCNDKSWYVKFTSKSFVPNLWHLKTILKKWQAPPKPLFKTSKPCGMQPKKKDGGEQDNDEQNILNSFKGCNN